MTWVEVLETRKPGARKLATRALDWHAVLLPERRCPSSYHEYDLGFESFGVRLVAKKYSVTLSRF